MSPNDMGAVSTAVDYDPFAGEALARVVPTTEPQREIWLAAKLECEASLAYNESVSLRLSGALDTGALQRALQILLDRHEALRATFSADGKELYIAERMDLACDIRDLTGGDPATRDAAVTATLQRVVVTPFDLEHGPLARAELLRLAADEHLLVFTAHHIVCDGWSFGVIVRDLAAIYTQLTGHGTGPMAADAFADFSLAQAAHAASDDGQDSERYWLSRFAGTAPSLDLPVDRARARRRTFTSLREDRVLDAALIADLKKMGARRGASLYATLLATFGIWLQRLSGQDDVVIGIPSAGQAVGGHGMLVGHCVNVLPLRVMLDAQASFSSVLDQVRGDLFDAFDHQQYTIGSLLARLALPRDPARLPLVSVLFNLDQALDESTVSFPGLRLDFRGNPRAFENFELFVNAVQVDGGVRLECQYNSDLFHGETIRCWLDAFEALLRNAIIDPGTAINALGMLSAPARQALHALQPLPTPYPSQQLAHEFFEVQVDRAPTRAAVSHGTNQLSYAALDARANRIAHCLRARGVGRGDLVGLMIARNTDMLAALLAVLKSGAGYVPMDPNFPADRLAFMAEDAALAALIVDDDAPAALAFPASHILSLTHDADTINAAATSRLAHDAQRATPDSLAYLIFTSGSTGRPKGVRVPHRATSNFLISMQQILGIVEDDRMVAVTTLSFDIAFMELLLPLSVGAEVVLAGYDDVRDGAALLALVQRSKASMMQATPAGWRVLIESGWSGHPRFKAIAGGEPLPMDLADALLQRCGDVWNAYGPTETTVWSTFWRVTDPRAGIFIGRPIANTVVHILDEQRAPCPLGVPGEIYIGGAGVTLGYLNRPELDAERFLPDGLTGDANARMYRTGDRGRWLASGMLEHLGRLDFQVKVRGYRIELGEIESVLVEIPGVTRAVVMAREDRPGDVRLVGYVVIADGATLDEDVVRAQLKGQLPDYMLPQHLIQLAAIPLLPNGKIDRKALPAPTMQSATAKAMRLAPSNDFERRVAAAMETVLALPDLDVRDNFFALGGHSLLAAQLTARLNREFGITLSFRTLFDAPTIADLAAAIGNEIESGKALAAQPIVPRADQDRAPLSLMQQRLWALEELQPGRVTYNAPSAHRLRGHLDEAAFEQALQALMQRQPIMRTAIRRNGEAVEQIIEARVALCLFPAEDLSALPDGERETVLMQRLQQLTDTPFDLTRAPLFSTHMFRLAADHHVFFFMPHHIIWDGWSFDILHAELSQLYRAALEGQPSPLPPLPVSYGDFAAWHSEWLEGEPFQTQLTYWRERLAHVPEARALPTDHPRRPGMSGVGRTEWIRVSKDATDALHEVARLADATLNMTLLSLYYVLLCSVAGQRHLVVGTPVRGRNQTEVESVMGYFNNLVPLHVSVDPTLGFVDFVRHVKRIAIDSFGHPDVPLEYLQRELHMGHGNGAVLYQALFSFQDARQRMIDWGGLQHEQILLFQSGATEDLGLWFLEGAGGMVGGVTYNADILQGETACLLRDRYLTMLSSISTNPHQPVAALTAINGDELAQLQHWNATAKAIRLPLSIPAMFESQADRTPEHTALIFGDREIRYAELEQHANRVATCLATRNVGRGGVTGLCVEPGMDWLAGMLGILKSGSTCVLLDSIDSAARLQDIILDACVTTLVGMSTLETALMWPRAKALWLDGDADEIAKASNGRVRVDIAADDVAIVVYSSDNPDGLQGVAMTHRAVANQCQGLQEILNLSTDDRALGTAPASTGMAVIECLLPLSLGAGFVQIGSHHTRYGETLAVTATTSRANVIFAAPETWQSMLSVGWAGGARLKAVCVGDAPTPELAAQLLACCDELWNVLGSSGSMLAASCGRIDADAQIIHDGRPLANTTAWVVDDHRQLCPIGAIGEICIGGDAIGVPFGRRAEAQSDYRTVNAFASSPDTQLVRTHFRGRWLASGRLQELGRLDRHLRIDGRDIRPAHIEARLMAQPGVAQAIAVARPGPSGDMQLDAFVVATPGSTLALNGLKSALAATLPVYELPRHVVLLDALPTLASGEVNLAALSLPEQVAEEETAVAAPAPTRTVSEQLLATIWQQLLGITDVRGSDNFFDIGGHSLLAVDMAARVKRDTGVQLNLLDIANGTFGTLAAELSRTPEKSVLPATLGVRLRGLFGLR